MLSKRSPHAERHVVQHLTAIKLALRMVERVGRLNRRQAWALELARCSTDQLVTDLLLASAMPRPGVASSAVQTTEPGHHEVRQWLGQAPDDPPDRAQAGRLVRHLLACAGCQAIARTLKATVQALRQLPRAPAPAALRQRLLDLARS